ncbi:hypothetical protein GCM10010336_69180 [Streptomyces goshikiensis]|nr:hypothetical protein GCM10010336_69180 [Streptomyces goshikiensis]
MTEKSSLTFSRSASRKRTCEAGQVLASVDLHAPLAPIKTTRQLSGMYGKVEDDMELLGLGCGREARARQAGHRVVALVVAMSAATVSQPW